MTLLGYIGRHLFWLGYRMQPPEIRRGISLISAIGLEWTKGEEESKLLRRAMAGEELDLALSFKTTDLISE